MEEVRSNSNDNNNNNSNDTGFIRATQAVFGTSNTKDTVSPKDDDVASSPVQHEFNYKGKKRLFEVPSHRNKSQKNNRERSYTSAPAPMSSSNKKIMSLSKITPAEYTAFLHFLGLNSYSFTNEKSIFEDNFGFLLKAASGSHFYFNQLSQLIYNTNYIESVYNFVKNKMKNLSDDQLMQLLVRANNMLIQRIKVPQNSLLSAIILSFYMEKDAASQRLVKTLLKGNFLKISRDYFEDYLRKIDILSEKEIDKFLNGKEEWEFDKDTVLKFCESALNYTDIVFYRTGPGCDKLPEKLVDTVYNIFKGSVRFALLNFPDAKKIPFKVSISGREETFYVPEPAIPFFFKTLTDFHLNSAVDNSIFDFNQEIKKFSDNKSSFLLWRRNSAKRNFIKEVLPFFISPNSLQFGLFEMVFHPDYVGLPLSFLVTMKNEGKFNFTPQHDVARELLLYIIKFKICEFLAEIASSESSIDDKKNLDEFKNNLVTNKDIYLFLSKTVNKNKINNLFNNFSTTARKKFEVSNSNKGNDGLLNKSHYDLLLKLENIFSDIDGIKFDYVIFSLGHIFFDFYKEQIFIRDKQFFSKNNEALLTVRDILLSENSISDDDIKQIMVSILESDYKSFLHLKEERLGAALYEIFNNQLKDQIKFGALKRKAVKFAPASTIAGDLKKGLAKEGSTAKDAAMLIDSLLVQERDAFFITIMGAIEDILTKIPKDLSHQDAEFLRRQHHAIDSPLFFKIINLFYGKELFNFQEKLIPSLAKSCSEDGRGVYIHTNAKIHASRIEPFIKLATESLHSEINFMACDPSANKDSEVLPKGYVFLKNFKGIFKPLEEKLIQALNFDSTHHLGNILTFLVKFYHSIATMEQKKISLFSELNRDAIKSILGFPNESSLSDEPVEIDFSFENKKYTLSQLNKIMRMLGMQIYSDKKAYSDYMVETFRQVSGLASSIPENEHFHHFLKKNCQANSSVISDNNKVEKEIVDEKSVKKLNEKISKCIFESTDEVLSPFAKYSFLLDLILSNPDPEKTRELIENVFSDIKSDGRQLTKKFKDFSNILAAQNYRSKIKSEDFFAALGVKDESLKECIDLEQRKKDIKEISEEIVKFQLRLEYAAKILNDVDDIVVLEKNISFEKYKEIAINITTSLNNRIEELDRDRQEDQETILKMGREQANLYSRIVVARNILPHERDMMGLSITGLRKLKNQNYQIYVDQINQLLQELNERKLYLEKSISIDKINVETEEELNFVEKKSKKENISFEQHVADLKERLEQLKKGSNLEKLKELLEGAGYFNKRAGFFDLSIISAQAQDGDLMGLLYKIFDNLSSQIKKNLEDLANFDSSNKFNLEKIKKSKHKKLEKLNIVLEARDHLEQFEDIYNKCPKKEEQGISGGIPIRDKHPILIKRLSCLNGIIAVEEEFAKKEDKTDYESRLMMANHDSKLAETLDLNVDYLKFVLNDNLMRFQRLKKMAELLTDKHEKYPALTRIIEIENEFLKTKENSDPEYQKMIEDHDVELLSWKIVDSNYLKMALSNKLTRRDRLKEISRLISQEVERYDLISSLIRNENNIRQLTQEINNYPEEKRILNSLKDEVEKYEEKILKNAQETANLIGECCLKNGEYLIFFQAFSHRANIEDKGKRIGVLVKSAIEKIKVTKKKHSSNPSSKEQRTMSSGETTIHVSTKKTSSSSTYMAEKLKSNSDKSDTVAVNPNNQDGVSIEIISSFENYEPDPKLVELFNQKNMLTVLKYCKNNIDTIYKYFEYFLAKADAKFDYDYMTVQGNIEKLKLMINEDSSKGIIYSQEIKDNAANLLNDLTKLIKANYSSSKNRAMMKILEILKDYEEIKEKANSNINKTETVDAKAYFDSTNRLALADTRDHSGSGSSGSSMGYQPESHSSSGSITGGSSIITNLGTPASNAGTQPPQDNAEFVEAPTFS